MKIQSKDLEAWKDLAGVIPKSYFAESEHSLAIFFRVELLLKIQHMLSGSIFFSSSFFLGGGE